MGSMIQPATGQVSQTEQQLISSRRKRVAASTANERLVEIMTQTVEMEVIPRLVRALRGDETAEPLSIRSPSLVSGEHIAQLVSLVTAREEAKAIAFVEFLHESGIPVEMLYLDLLAPTARQLGQMWTDDDCDFTDVTIGLFLLQNALRELGAAFQQDLATEALAPRALLVPLPGEQHTFGLSMVFDFFRRAGWNVWSGPIASDAVLADMVSNASFDVVGFSLACDEQLDDARQVIRLVRKHSRNPAVAVMVGGPGFAANPALAALVGADGTAIDGQQAVQQARALVNLATSRR
ncbi:B12-binding domain-containing protein [Acidisphaera sp. L21]|uniref:cobalamin B12-binding domain-containing protein n=1 Tax=Acidisphaera sp. L21 TaxID=1641851 RepID=UPI00131C04A5|nr:cobalamin B12-binding domain-containing protein [Acidisphaera sp. L21]